MTTHRPCSYCDGSKIFIKFKCLECAGTGENVQRFEHNLMIQPGVLDGEILTITPDPRLKHLITRGDGNVLAKVVVEKSDVFTRKGLDIHSRLDLSPIEALHGGIVTTRGLHDYKMKVELPRSGVSSHETITVEGAGIRTSYGRGDHVVEIGICCDKMTDSDREQVRKAFPSEATEDGTESSDFSDNPNVLVMPKVLGRSFK